MAEDRQWEDKPGEGYAQPAKNKTEDWHDDFSGQIIIPLDAVPGKKYWFSVKDAVSKAGNDYRRVKLGNPVKEDSSSVAPAPAPTQNKNTQIDDFEDDLPF